MGNFAKGVKFFIAVAILLIIAILVDTYVSNDASYKLPILYMSGISALICTIIGSILIFVGDDFKPKYN